MQNEIKGETYFGVKMFKFKSMQRSSFQIVQRKNNENLCMYFIVFAPK